MKFVIKVPPITKKNHSQIVFCKSKTGRLRPAIIPSKQFIQFEKDCEDYVPELHIDYPINLKAVFYMETRRRVDLVNLQEALLDVLVKYECLKDDNSLIVASMDGSCVAYDKLAPRIEVEIERIQDVGNN